MIWAEASVISDQFRGLDDTDSAKPKRVAQTIAKLAAGVERGLLIESAYLVLGGQGLALTRRLTDRGVAVRALTHERENFSYPFTSTPAALPAAKSF